MKNNVVYMKDFVKDRTEKIILEAIDLSEEALSFNDYNNAREFYWAAHMIYTELGKNISYVSNRLNNLEQDLFFR